MAKMSWLAMLRAVWGVSARLERVTRRLDVVRMSIWCATTLSRMTAVRPADPMDILFPSDRERHHSRRDDCRSTGSDLLDCE